MYCDTACNLIQHKVASPCRLEQKQWARPVKVCKVCVTFTHTIPLAHSLIETKMNQTIQGVSWTLPTGGLVSSSRPRTPRALETSILPENISVCEVRQHKGSAQQLSASQKASMLGSSQKITLKGMENDVVVSEPGCKSMFNQPPGTNNLNGQIEGKGSKYDPPKSGGLCGSCFIIAQCYPLKRSLFGPFLVSSNRQGTISTSPALQACSPVRQINMTFHEWKNTSTCGIVCTSSCWVTFGAKLNSKRSTCVGISRFYDKICHGCKQRTWNQQFQKNLGAKNDPLKKLTTVYSSIKLHDPTALIFRSTAPANPCAVGIRFVGDPNVQGILRDAVLGTKTENNLRYLIWLGFHRHQKNL